MDKSRLLTNRIVTEDYTIDGVGTIVLKALNRHEALLVGMADTNVLKETLILKYGVADPSLSNEDIKKWSENSPGAEIEAVTEKIADLSGMLEGSDKDTFPVDGGESSD